MTKIGVAATTCGTRAIDAAIASPSSKRGRPFGIKTPTKPISALEQTQIAAMSATGVSIRKMAAALKTDHRRVRAILDMPSVGAMRADFREMVKVQALHGIQKTQEDVWRQVGEAAKSGDAKEFRDWTSGALNLEKIAYSASGEAKPQIEAQDVIHGKSIREKR